MRLPREPLADHPNPKVRDALLKKREPSSLISGQKAKFVARDAYREGWDRIFGAENDRPGVSPYNEPVLGGAVKLADDLIARGIASDPKEFNGLAVNEALNTDTAPTDPDFVPDTSDWWVYIPECTCAYCLAIYRSGALYDGEIEAEVSPDALDAILKDQGIR